MSDTHDVCLISSPHYHPLDPPHPQALSFLSVAKVQCPDDGFFGAFDELCLKEPLSFNRLNQDLAFFITPLSRPHQLQPEGAPLLSFCFLQYEALSLLLVVLLLAMSSKGWRLIHRWRSSSHRYATNVKVIHIQLIEIISRLSMEELA